MILHTFTCKRKKYIEVLIVYDMTNLCMDYDLFLKDSLYGIWKPD